jgi:hypothetical protein
MKVARIQKPDHTEPAPQHCDGRLAPQAIRSDRLHEVSDRPS